MEDRHAILLAAATLLGPKLQDYPVPWSPDQMGDFLNGTVKLAETLLATITMHRTGEEH
jgi:hypothetical protein